ncbi:MAG: protein-glutamate O-methyltransferase CheR [Bryobacterales bacterium]|nr:protein-glutamate O-methyltransferase CheR [Bryobacterales bacterium]
MQTVLAEKQSIQSSITAENYAFLQRYIYQESGIVIDAGKNYLLESRLLPIVKQENLSTLNDLCNLLRATAPLPLKSKVVESMTTNETLFFRDIALFDGFQKNVLPELINARRDTKKISIWSAAASSGQEAYSIAMILKDMGLEGWRIQILGTDLNQQILDRAAAGRYLQIEVNRGLPAKYLVKHFTRVGLDWQINDSLRSMVSFQKFDLRSSMRSLGPFDIVFCRNVLIYFDVETKKKILSEIQKTMNSRGLLALGAAETTINLSTTYSRVAYGPATFYQVP